MRRILEKLVLAVALIRGIAAIIYFTIPLGNTDIKHFYTLLVLGYPSNLDGAPSHEQRSACWKPCASIERALRR